MSCINNVPETINSDLRRQIKGLYSIQQNILKISLGAFCEQCKKVNRHARVGDAESDKLGFARHEAHSDL